MERLSLYVKAVLFLNFLLNLNGNDVHPQRQKRSFERLCIYCINGEFDATVKCQNQGWTRLAELNCK